MKEKKDILSTIGYTEEPKAIPAHKQAAAIIARNIQSPFKPRPGNNWIIVELIDVKPEEKTKSGIYLASGDKQKDVTTMLYTEHPLQGVVLRVGPKELEYKANDYVYISREMRNPIMYNEKWYYAVQNLDIVCVIE